MRDTRRFISVAFAFLLLSAGASPSDTRTVQPPGAAEARTAEASGRVKVTVEGFKSAKGQALVSLYLNDSGWPGDATLAFAARTIPIGDDLRAVVEFDKVPSGPFAVSVVHDKNRNRKLDKGLFGIPREAYGFSRDARSTFHAPSFADARLEIAPGEAKNITVHVG